jgi:hypothetical protein
MSGNSAAEQWRLYATPQGTKVIRDEIDAFEVGAYTYYASAWLTMSTIADVHS